MLLCTLGHCSLVLFPFLFIRLDKCGTSHAQLTSKTFRPPASYSANADPPLSSPSPPPPSLRRFHAYLVNDMGGPTGVQAAHFFAKRKEIII